MSFGWLGTFREGAWRSFRSFVLRERKDLAKRLSYIDAYLKKLGTITVRYNRTEEEGETRVTEERKGFFVTRGTSLEKLVQAYVVQGGNPLDISHFFMPDLAFIQNRNADGSPEELENLYPYGGVAAPISAEYNDPINSFGQYRGGYVPLRKYTPLRTGGRKDLDADAEPFVNLVHFARRQIKREIDYKRNRLEWRIKKLCDLREKLLEERNEILTQAYGGLSEGLEEFDQTRYAVGLRVPAIINLIDRIFYVKNDDGSIDFLQINQEELTKYQNLFEDILPDESNTAL